MAYIDSTTAVIKAILTRKGREALARNDGSFKITKYALGDDEIDYGLWESTQPGNLEGRVIENMPLLESFLNQKEMKNL